ncbi:hypothetical protein UFOVP353_52 [uncultured Caudovirales phage]|uniref:Uncharacterized protein n=1 Tax=uncultured Caudovirales phage TaxID=2100421 RepID=A0A6J5M380_9CAUD|nr:hypothetical protein UFOVP353_52 [uncultured Caudovirales phage]
MNIIQQKNEALESVSSYAIGGGGAMMAFLIDLSNLAQAMAIIFGCLVVLVRLVHDSVRLIRFIRDNNKRD